MIGWGSCACRARKSVARRADVPHPDPTERLGVDDEAYWPCFTVVMPSAGEPFEPGSASDRMR